MELTLEAEPDAPRRSGLYDYLPVRELISTGKAQGRQPCWALRPNLTAASRWMAPNPFPRSAKFDAAASP
jgi:hypothetical protein